MLKSLYLDNCSTTPIDHAVIDYVAECSKVAWGNASSIHSSGRKASRLLSDSRKIIADSIGASVKEIVFTSSGTESNNMVIGGFVSKCVRENIPCHIISSAVEHPSISKRLEWEEKNNNGRISISLIGVNEIGQLKREEVWNAVTSETELISFLLVNNETGVVQDLDFIKEIKLRFPRVILHLDIVQAYGKIPIDVRKYPVDALTFCSHKIHGPKGIGCLYIRNGITFDPILIGGAQEKFRRAGTEDVVNIAAFAKAVELMPDSSESHTHMVDLETRFLSSLKKNHINFIVNGPVESDGGRMPGFINLSFPGVKSKEDLQIALDLQNVQVSSTSACHSGVVSDSAVLKGMGVPGELRAGAIRIAFNRYHTVQDAEEAALRIACVVKRILEVS